MDSVLNLHLLSFGRQYEHCYLTPEATDPYVNYCGFISNIVLVSPYGMFTFNVV